MILHLQERTLVRLASAEDDGVEVDGVYSDDDSDVGVDFETALHSEGEREEVDEDEDWEFEDEADGAQPVQVLADSE